MWDREVTPHQFANDWISTKDNEILDPTWCKPNEMELAGMFSHRNSQSVGLFWSFWEIGPDGFFVSR
jgi:hypothetical protein